MKDSDWAAKHGDVKGDQYVITFKRGEQLHEVALNASRLDPKASKGAGGVDRGDARGARRHLGGRVGRAGARGMSSITHAAFYAEAFPELRAHFGKRLESLDVEGRNSDANGRRFEFVARFRDVRDAKQYWELRLGFRGTLTDELIGKYAGILARQAIALEQAQLGMSPPLPVEPTQDEPRPYRSQS